MADRFHFNPETGRTGKCSAQVQCRFGQTEDQHGATREIAQANYERQMASQLFAPTDRSTAPLSTGEISALKEELLDSSSGHAVWRSEQARAAAIRYSLERAGVDTSSVGSEELRGAAYYRLNGEGTSIVGLFSSELDSISGAEGRTKSRAVLEIEAKERIAEATAGYDPVRSGAQMGAFRAVLIREKLAS